MRQRTKPKRRSSKSILRLPDLDHSRSSVLQSLGSTDSKRTYGFAIDDFISWYCSEPRLAFGRTVVLRYRYELESRQLAPPPSTCVLQPFGGWHIAVRQLDLLNEVLFEQFLRFLQSFFRQPHGLGFVLWIGNITSFVEAPQGSPVLPFPGTHTRAIFIGCQVQERENHLIDLFLIMFHGSLDHVTILMPALWQHMTSTENGRQAAGEVTEMACQVNRSMQHYLIS
jgi:hypothetical protein